MKVFRWATKLQKVGGKNIEWNNSLSDEKSVLFLDTAAKVEGEVWKEWGSLDDKYETRDGRPK